MMMNNSLGNLRAFRAAVVLLLIIFTHACTKTPLPPDTCPGGCSAQMVFPVEKGENGYYSVELDWDREYLPYFSIDLIASKVNPEYHYNGISAVSAELYSNATWILESSGLVVDVVQESSVYFSESGNNLRSRRVVGPFPPEMIGDTVTIHMEVFWDAGMNSKILRYSEKFIVK